MSDPVTDGLAGGQSGHRRCCSFRGCEEIVVAGGEHGVFVTGSSPDHWEFGKGSVDDGSDLAGVTNGCDATNVLARVSKDKVCRCAPYLADVQVVGEGCGVYSMGAAGQDQQRLPIGGEHQAVGDGSDLAAEGFGRRSRCGDGLLECSELSNDTCGAERGFDLGDRL